MRMKIVKSFTYKISNKILFPQSFTFNPPPPAPKHTTTINAIFGNQGGLGLPRYNAFISGCLS